MKHRLFFLIIGLVVLAVGQLVAPTVQASEQLVISSGQTILPSGTFTINTGNDYENISLYNVVPKESGIFGFSLPGNYAIKAYIGAFTKNVSGQWTISNVGVPHNSTNELYGSQTYLAVAKRRSIGSDYSSPLTVAIVSNLNDAQKTEKKGDKQLASTSWSPTWSFTTLASTTGSTTLGVPELSSPLGQSDLDASMVYFIWKRVDGADKYTLQVSLDSTFTSPQTYNNIKALDSLYWKPPVYYGVALKADTTYYWRARAENAQSTGSFSVIGQFKTKATGGVIEQPNPVNGSCGSVNNSTVDSLSSGASYLCANGSSSTLSGTGPWTWTCQGSNGGSSVTCQAYKTSSVSYDAPVPVNCSYIQAANQSDLSQPLSWSAVNNTYRYQIRVATSQTNLTNNVLLYSNSNVYSTEITIPASYLNYSQTYYWQVKDAANASAPWSSACNFTTRVATPLPATLTVVADQGGQLNPLNIGTLNFTASLTNSSDTNITWLVQKSGVTISSQTDDLTYGLNISGYTDGTYTMTASNSQASNSVNFEIKGPYFGVPSQAGSSFNADNTTLNIVMPDNMLTSSFASSSSVELWRVDASGNKITPLGKVGTMAITDYQCAKNWDGKNFISQIWPSGTYSLKAYGTDKNSNVFSSSAFNITILRNAPVLLISSAYEGLTINPDVTLAITAGVDEQKAEGKNFSRFIWRVYDWNNTMVDEFYNSTPNLILTIRDYANGAYRIKISGEYKDFYDVTQTYDSTDQINFTVAR